MEGRVDGPPPDVRRDIVNSHLPNGAGVGWLPYQLHHLAREFGVLPWELEAMNPPVDVVLRALAIMAADAEGERRANQRATKRGKSSG